MIQAEDIRRKAENLYPLFLRAWLAGENFFPRHVPCDRKVDPNLAVAIQSVQRLRAESKEVRSFGYSIEWEERNSRTHGRNQFPRRIIFESEDDLLRFIGKQHEFKRFSSAVDRVRTKYPVLSDWIRSNTRLFIESATEIDGLLEVVDYLQAHPRPDRFARELPLSVDTKFIERHRRILAGWLDLILPPHAIRADEIHFDRRYGLRYIEPHISIRFLDSHRQQSAGSPWVHCSVPLHSLAATQLSAKRVIIVENKVNLLTLPEIHDTVALGGLGGGVTDLRYLQWLSTSEIWYWGDIDVEGFGILARLRAFFPHVQSLLMDDTTVREWRDRIGTSGTGRTVDPPANLTSSERLAHLACTADNLRIEQERFPHEFVLGYLAATLGQ